MDTKPVRFWKFPALEGYENTVYCGSVGDERLVRKGGHVSVYWELNVPLVHKHRGVEVFPTIKLDTPEQTLTETFGPIASLDTAWDKTPTVECKTEVGCPTVLEVLGAKKFDSNKPMMDLLFDGCPNAIEGVAQVLTYGFHKYGGKHGWKALPDAIKRYEAAMIRHQLAKAKGECIDPESGLPHSYHIACNAMFLAEFDATWRERNAK